MIKIIKIKVLDDYHIHFAFSDGCEKLIDFKQFIKNDMLTGQLKDAEFF
jgi:hypothetical protein